MSGWKQLHREHREKNREQEILQRKKRGLGEPKKGSISDYCYRLSGTKKWWSKYDSTDYIDVINGVKILNHLQYDQDVIDYDKFEIYDDLKEKCEKYLNNHRGYRWTFVGKKRYRLISELFELLKNMMKLGPLQTLNTIPYFISGNDENKVKKVKAINEKFANESIYGKDGFYNYFTKEGRRDPFFNIINAELDNSYVENFTKKGNYNDNESSKNSLSEDNELDIIGRIKRKIEAADEKNRGNGMEIHIGNRFHIRGLGISRIFPLRHVNGFHIKANEVENFKYIEIMFDNLLAGDAYDVDKAQSVDKNKIDNLSENERKNIDGMLQYKEVLYNHYKYIYKKYGKYIYQLHPIDIISRTDSFWQDISLLQDINQYFGLKGDDFETCEKNFENNLKKNPILCYIFPEKDKDKDLLFLKLAIYYNYIFVRFPHLNGPNISQIFKEETIYKNIALEKEIEDGAIKYGWGKMQGLDESEKAVYLLNLKCRNLDKEFNLYERLITK